MPDVPYRTEFPLASITRAIAIVRAGDVVDHANEFAYHAYQFQSWGQGRLLPYDPGGNIVPIAAPALSEGEIAALVDLHGSVQQLEGSATASFGGGSDWIALLLPLLQELLRRFLAGS